jgi:hypothetical protein
MRARIFRDPERAARQKRSQAQLAVARRCYLCACLSTENDVIPSRDVSYSIFELIAEGDVAKRFSTPPSFVTSLSARRNSGAPKRLFV